MRQVRQELILDAIGRVRLARLFAGNLEQPPIVQPERHPNYGDEGRDGGQSQGGGFAHTPFGVQTPGRLHLSRRGLA